MPVYNEAPVVASVIRDLLPAFPHIACIDDGSTDGSAQEARAAGAVVIEHPINLGQGAALQTGLDYVLQDPEVDCVITFDADGQHRPADAAAMVARVRSGEADVVLGSRFLGQDSHVSGVKKLVLRTAAWQSSLSSGLKLTDAHNGLRVLHADVARSIRLRQHRMAHASELIQQLSQHRPRVVEHPVEILYTDYSRAKGQSLLNGVNILVDLFLR
jgi:glycosyltransferase involved in cell wall biosynthesis